MSESYENVLRLVLIILILFFIASSMRILDSATGNFIGLKNKFEPIGINLEARNALKYGCADSDGGDNLFVPGVVNYRFNGKLIQSIDVCADYATLLEQACLGNDRTSNVGVEQITIEHTCTDGCLNGACLENTPVDNYLHSPGL